MNDTLAALMAAHLAQAALIWMAAHLALRRIEAGRAHGRLRLASWAFYGAALMPMAALLPRHFSLSIGAMDTPMLSASAPLAAVDFPFANAFLALIAIGALLGLVLTSWRSLQGEALVARAEAIEPSCVGLPMRTSIALSDEVTGPMVASLINPTILLPRAALRLPVSERAAVLRHEFAHLARKDVRNALLQRLVLDLFWWSPPMRALGALLSEQREMACDARADSEDEGYLDALVNAARRKCQPSALGVAMSGPQLERRVLRLAASNFKSIKICAAAFALVFFASLLLTPRGKPDGVTHIHVASV